MNLLKLLTKQHALPITRFWTIVYKNNDHSAMARRNFLLFFKCSSLETSEVLLEVRIAEWMIFLRKRLQHLRNISLSYFMLRTPQLANISPFRANNSPALQNWRIWEIWQCWRTSVLAWLWWVWWPRRKGRIFPRAGQATFTLWGSSARLFSPISIYFRKRRRIGWWYLTRYFFWHSKSISHSFWQLFLTASEKPLAGHWNYFLRLQYWLQSDFSRLALRILVEPTKSYKVRARRNRQWEGISSKLRSNMLGRAQTGYKYCWLSWYRDSRPCVLELI